FHSDIFCYRRAKGAQRLLKCDETPGDDYRAFIGMNKHRFHFVWPDYLFLIFKGAFIFHMSLFTLGVLIASAIVIDLGLVINLYNHLLRRALFIVIDWKVAGFAPEESLSSGVTLGMRYYYLLGGCAFPSPVGNI
ncbi:hypothetical protein ACJX0J_034451, partial [Zea mays]